MSNIDQEHILFFSHNKRHYLFFKGVGAMLERGMDACASVRHLTDSDHETDLPVESTNLRIMAEIDMLDDIGAELDRIRAEYPRFDALQAMTGDRILNFFPRYLSTPKVPFESQEKYMVSAFRVFEQDLQDCPTSIIFSELVIGLQDAVLQAVAEKRGIPYVGMRASKLGEGVVFCDPYTEIPFGFDETFHRYTEDAATIPAEIVTAAWAHLEKLRGKYETPVYMKETGRDAAYVERGHVRRLYETLVVDRAPVKGASFLYLDTWKRLKYRLLRMRNLWQLRGRHGQTLFTDLDSLEGQRFVIFPLQFEPEATTLIRAYPLVDQIGLVKMLAKMLPHGVRLAVKEHRGNEGYRKLRDYEELHYEPNIVLLPRVMDVGKLVRQSIGVVTLSGRMGWEALVLGKPAFVLGRAFWSLFPGAHRLAGPEDFRTAFAGWESGGRTIDYTDEALAAYAGAYMAHTYPGIFLGKSPSLMTSENIAEIAGSIRSSMMDILDARAAL
jgi:hypothetical protein